MKRELADSEMNESIPTQISGSTSKRVNTGSCKIPHYFLKTKFVFRGAVHPLNYTRIFVVTSHTHGYT